MIYLLLEMLEGIQILNCSTSYQGDVAHLVVLTSLVASSWWVVSDVVVCKKSTEEALRSCSKMMGYLVPPHSIFDQKFEGSETTF